MVAALSPAIWRTVPLVAAVSTTSAHAGICTVATTSSALLPPPFCKRTWYDASRPMAICFGPRMADVIAGAELVTSTPGGLSEARLVPSAVLGADGELDLNAVTASRSLFSFSTVSVLELARAAGSDATRGEGTA